MTEYSRQIFEFLKKNSKKEFTKRQIVEALNVPMSAVNGSVNGLCRNGYASERIEIIKPKYEGVADMEVRFIQITPAGIAFDPDEAERQKKRLQLEQRAARKEAKEKLKEELARQNFVL